VADNDAKVTNLTAHKIAWMIVEHWSDSYSDNGAVWERSRKALEVVQATASPEIWEEALVIAHNLWGSEN